MNRAQSLIRDILWRETLVRAFRVWATLLKVMIPVVLAVKAVKELGFIPALAAPLGPVMDFVGLPAEMGLVWATAMVSNIYAGLIVFSSLADAAALTAAQATVLGVLVLVAHNLPVELEIARATGTRPLFQLVLRFAGAVALGFLVGRVYGALGLGAAPAAVLWRAPAEAGAGLWGWALGEARNLLFVYLIIASLLLFLRLLGWLRVTRLMHRLLAPVLRVIGVGPGGATLAVVGLTMGIAYGGGLMIEEVKRGEAGGRDVFHTLSFLALCHSIFEDSLLLATIGGLFSGLLVGRLCFAIAATALLARLTRGMGAGRFARWCWRPPGEGAAREG